MDGDKLIAAENGYSLVETLVAMAILMAVLVPAIMFLGIAGNNSIARDKIISFNLAKNAMEHALVVAKDSSSMEKVNDKWVVYTKIENLSDNLYTIKVNVFKDDTLKPPLITLDTRRLWYIED